MIVWALLMVSVWSVVSAVQTCGYQSCNPVVPGKINVHLVAHSHDDVGWLKTVDQYFLGANNSIQLAGVQYILDSVVQELLNDPQKRFIYVEVAFFARWWRQQHDMIRHRVRDLVNQGRLEFILGGWCMNDEATTHYNDIIDQHTLGFEFLRQNFGDCGRPRVAWQIDPFGHSREQASLFAQMGFDGLFFGRLDYQDKSTREQSKTMEMMWRGSPDNLGAHADLFTGVLPNTYSPPDGFCFDLLCYGPALNDDRRLKEYNMDEMVQKFISITTKQREKYDTDQLIMTMGNDFNYQSANAWYKNLDKLIEHVNQADSNVHLLYSTPSCYLKAVNEQNVTLTTKSDDFFPYAHRPHSFWTGYFTSRPTLKYYVRQSNNFLQACKQLDALAFLEDTDNSTYEINILKKAMGVAQHHDAVSGTEKQHVAYDYAQRLAQGVAECQKVVNDAYKKLLPKNRTSAAPEQYFCNLLNISVCMASTHNKQFQVTIYNPLARRVDHWLRLPVSLESYEVRDYNGTKIPTQLIPIGKDTKRIPERGSSTLAKYSLVFSVSLPPLGFSTYFVSRVKDKRLRHEQRSLKRKFARLSGTQQVKNEFVSLEFDTTSGRLVRMTNLESSISISLQQDIFYYIGTTGNNSRGDLQASGAYVFRPNGSQAFHPKYLQKSYLLQGPLVQEVHQTFSPWVTQVVRLYNGAHHAEFEWTVGPIPIGKNESKEVVSRFSSSILSQKVFYTDANGREVLRREADKRNTWDFEQTEPIAGNYYPVNSRIFIKDDNQQLTILTDRTQGGTSASNSNGVIDLMVHRRLFHDDGLGVGEPLNETGSDNKGLIARGTHYVHLDSPGRSASFHRQMGLKLYMQPIVSFSNSTMKQSDWVGKYHTSWSGLNTPLPNNLHLLTLEQWGAAGVLPSHNQPYLLRLENIFEREEDSYLSRNVTVDLNTLFKNITIQSVHELTLGANLPLTNLTRLQWLYNGSSPDEERVRMGLSQNTVTLQPMEIRTFQLNF